MPIQTDLNVSPYYDDYNENRDYYKILFRPTVAVQVRELNQLQTILQKQVERFGNNIYKRGTIIDGCNFIFHNPLPYVKINDNELGGAPASVSSYRGYFAKSSSNLISYVIDTDIGYESTSPDLNTLFLKYLNSGESTNQSSYNQGDILTIYDGNNSIFNVSIEAGSSTFSNDDTIVFLSAIEVQNSTGGIAFSNSSGGANVFTVGEEIRQLITNAKAEIVEVNSVANATSLVLKIKPIAPDLVFANAEGWAFNENYAIIGNTTTVSANVVNIVGSGANASLVTDTNGKIISVAVTERGEGYYIPPYVSVSSSSANSERIEAANLVAENYLAQVTVNSDDANSVGNGYGFSITDGVIYQKGYFARVEEQFIVVDKYTTNTNNVVGFDTTESIVNSNSDATLLDNSTGTLNVNAPGANRLKLTPTLVVMSKEDATANDEFLTVVEFSEGRPFKQNRGTQFNSISHEMARRTAEESGDYVVDPFYLNSKHTENFIDDPEYFSIEVDTGVAYIDGYRVETTENYSKIVRKATNTSVRENVDLSINYGNYIRVNQVGGLFKFNVGDLVSIRDTAASYLTLLPGETIVAPGAEIGKARIRSFTYEQGIEGSPNAVYRLYLFDIKMNAGKNFKESRAIYYDGATQDAIADIILTLDGTTSANIAQIQNPGNSTMVFYSGATALKNANNINYTYRTISETLIANTSGKILISVSSSPGESFPYANDLSDNEKEDIIVMPLANIVMAANLSGSITGANGQPNVTGSSTSFTTQVTVGDYLYFYDTGKHGQVSQIVNNTLLILSANLTQALTTDNTAIAFPQFVPVKLAGRDDRSVQVIANTTLRISLTNSTFSAIGANTTVSAAFNVKKAANSVTKTVNRKNYIKIRFANNDANGALTANITGNADFSTSGTTVTGNGTDFTTNFANGDYIAYYANSTIYHIGQVNTVTNAISLELTANALATVSGVAVAKVQGNTTGPWPIGVPDIIRLRNVYVSNSINVNTASTSVVGNFYIDHNQTKDFYDNGWLYKNKNFTVTQNDVLLVEYDAHTASEPGLKTIASYSIDDTANLMSSNTTINTLELPEMYSDKDEYFDLRDYFDFRPYTSNTVALQSNQLIAPVNPAEPSQATRFDVSADKKFPAPQSDCFATIESYLGRNDAVVITANGEFNVITGKAGEIREYPIVPSDAMLINYMEIPPYPSLPSSYSYETAEFLETRTINIKNLEKRKRIFSVNIPISESDRARNQPRRYTMYDIGQLDRRIADLEYYSSLSFIEDEIRDKTITSSIDPAINRFKFGFFVDNFTTTNFADLDDPDYNATIFGYQLHPRKEQLQLQFKFNMLDDDTAIGIRGTKLMMPSEDHILISQLNATDATSTDVSVASTTTTTTTATTSTTTTSTSNVATTSNVVRYRPVTTTTKITKRAAFSATGGSRPVIHFHPFKFGPDSGLVTIYFSHRSKPDGYRIFQSISNVWTIPSWDPPGGGSGYSDTYVTSRGFTFITTSAGATSLSSADRNYFAKNFGSGLVGSPLGPQYFGYGYPGEGKFTFSYDASKGRNIVIVGAHGKDSDNYNAWIEYPDTVTTTTQQAITDTVTSTRPVTVTNTAVTVAVSEVSVVKPVFNSKYTGALDIAQLFLPSIQLASPYIDLADYIRNELKSNK